MTRFPSIWVPLLLAVFVLACTGVTDTGNPPLQPPALDGVTVMFLAADTITLLAPPGAVAEPTGTVRITALTSDWQVGAVVDAAVAEDASFEATLPAEADSTLRVQWIANDARSTPVDLDVGGEPAPVRLPCLSLEPALHVHQAAVVEARVLPVRVHNACDDGLSLGAQLRPALASLVARVRLLEEPLPPGQSTVMEIDVEPVSTDAESVVVLFANAMPVRALTLSVGAL